MIAHNSKYPVLSSVANILIVIGWTMVAAGTITLIYGIAESQQGFGLGNILFSASGTIAAALGLILAITGELVGVFFDIELNTRTAGTSGRTQESTPQG